MKLQKKNKVLFKLYKFDLSDKKKFKNISKNKLNIIINLAAQAGVRYSLQKPHSYVKSNIEGFLNILELARCIKKSTVIYASTSSVYGGSKDTPFDEKTSSTSFTTLRSNKKI